MTQYLTDLAQRSALAQQLARQPMAKLMRTVSRRLNAGTLERMTNDGANPTGPPKTAKRCFGTQKYPPAGTVRSTLLQIRRDRLAYLRRQRKFVTPPALAAHMQGGGVPVDIIEFEQYHFART